MVSIFHAVHPTFSESRTPCAKFAHVADVETDDLEDAFERTNSIDQAWWLNKGVTKTFPGTGCRSTSVGDMAILNGVTYMCAGCGWEELTPTPKAN